MMTVYENRRDAGRQLAAALTPYAGQDPVVLGLPRGGVPVACEVARALNAPLDVLVVRKLGVPGHEELAMGAIASGGARVLNEDVIAALHIPDDWVERVVARERAELERRERLYRGGRPLVEVADRTAILVDDGLATGATMRAAAQSMRQRNPRLLVAAVPVGAPDSCAMLARYVDRMICLEEPRYFMGVSRWYREFGQTTDEEVRRLLARTEEGALHAQP